MWKWVNKIIDEDLFLFCIGFPMYDWINTHHILFLTMHLRIEIDFLVLVSDDLSLTVCDPKEKRGYLIGIDSLFCLISCLVFVVVKSDINKMLDGLRGILSLFWLIDWLFSLSHFNDLKDYSRWNKWNIKRTTASISNKKVLFVSGVTEDKKCQRKWR